MATDDLGGFASEAEKLASEHPQQADQLIGKAGDAVNQETGDKFSGEIDAGEKKAEDYLGAQGGQQQPPPPQQ